MTRPTVSTSRGSRSHTRHRSHRSLLALILSLVVYAVLWQIVSLTMARTIEHPEFVMPDLGYALVHGLPNLSVYYTGSFPGIPASFGAAPSWELGVLALLQHSLVSLMRFGLGLVIGVLLGMAVGLAMATRPSLSMSFLGTANFFRMLPILAMAPLFTLWFGATTLASVVFIVFVVAPIMLIATISAVRGLDPSTSEYARTLGISGGAVLRRVILPGIVPALGGALSVVIVLAWSVLLASELYGIQDGIGWMMGQALQFTQMGAVMVIAGAFIVLAFATVPVGTALVRRLSVWAE